MFNRSPTSCGEASFPITFNLEFDQERFEAHDLRRWVRFFSITVGCSPLHAGASKESFVVSVLGCPHFGCPERDEDMSQFQESLPSTGGKAQSFTPDAARNTSHPQVAHNVALVLGGGGAAGMPGRSGSSQAWPKRVSTSQRPPIW